MPPARSSSALLLAAALALVTGVPALSGAAAKAAVAAAPRTAPARTTAGTAGHMRAASRPTAPRPPVVPAPYAGLVPAPRHVAPSAARVDLGAPWTLVIRTGSRDDTTAATLLAREAAQRGWSWRTRPRATARVVELVAAAVAASGESTRGEAYRLEITPRLITIAAPTTAGRFEAVQTLRQLLRISPDRLVPAATVDDEPAFPFRAVSIDISRGQVPRTQALADVVREIAYYKLNTLVLYVEDTFEFSSAPLVRRTDRLSVADVRALNDVARKNHVELVPMVETLGHQERLLSVPAYGDLAERPQPFSLGDRLRAWWSDVVPQGETPVRRDGPATLCPTDPRAETLAHGMLGDAAGAFESRCIGVGGDEAGEVGDGRSAEAVRARGKSAVIGSWFARLDAPLRAGGRRMLVYSDMIDASDARGPWPRDADVVVWDYDTTATFARADSLKGAGFRSLVLSGGLWDWRAFHPDLGRGFASLAAATRAARRVGATGILASSWGDGGAESLLENDWAGFAYAAACAWEGTAAAPEPFLARFAAAHCGAEAGGLARVEELLGGQGFGGLERNGIAFHREPVVKPRGAAWLDRMRRLRTDMQEAARVLDECGEHASTNREHVAALRHSMRRYRYLADREIVLDDVGRSLGERGASSAGAGGADAQLAAEIGGLAVQLGGLSTEYETLWLKQCRPGGLAFNLQRLTRQKAELDALRVRARDGKLEVWRPRNAGGAGS